MIRTLTCLIEHNIRIWADIKMINQLKNKVDLIMKEINSQNHKLISKNKLNTV